MQGLGLRGLSLLGVKSSPGHPLASARLAILVGGFVPRDPATALPSVDDSGVRVGA